MFLRQLISSQLTLIPTKVTFQYAEQSINHIIMLKTYVNAIKPIFEALANAQSDLLLAVRDVRLCVLLFFSFLFFLSFFFFPLSLSFIEGYN